MDMEKQQRDETLLLLREEVFPDFLPLFPQSRREEAGTLMLWRERVFFAPCLFRYSFPFS